MDRLRPHLTYANVVATICLFLVLGGGAWAASSLPKNSVGTKQLKNGAVTGAKVKKGALTGADIQASTLGKVPQAASAGTAADAGHATSADNAVHADSATSAGHANSADSATRAGDATTLGGLGPGAFYPAAGVQRIDATPVYLGASVTIYSTDGVVLTAICTEGGLVGSTALEIIATSTTAGARADAGYSERLGSTNSAGTLEVGIGSTPVEVWGTFASPGATSGQTVGTVVYTDSLRSIDFTLESRASSTHECQISGTAMLNG